MSDFSIEIGFEDGAVVAYCPQTGTRERVDLVEHARAMSDQGQIERTGELEEYLGSIGGPPEVSGKIARKIKKGVKAVGKGVVKAASAAVKSKLVKGIYSAVQMVTPQPFKAGLTIAQKGVGFAKKAAKKGSKASKAAPTVTKLAAGKITPQQAEKEAKRAGVDPEDVKAAALTVKLKESADAGDEKAAAVMQTIEKIEGAQSNDPQLEDDALALGAEAKIRRDYPDASVMRVVDPSGVTRLTAVIPLS